MKKIILIGSEGVLGKHYSKILKFQKLVVADIKIKKTFNKKNRFIGKKLDIENEGEIEFF